VNKIEQNLPAYGCCAESDDGRHSVIQSIVHHLLWGIKPHGGEIYLCNEINQMNHEIGGALATANIITFCDWEQTF